MLPSSLVVNVRLRLITLFWPLVLVCNPTYILHIVSRPMPNLPVDNAKERIIDSTGALKLSKVPERLIVVGGGVIGLELGSVWRRLGAKVEVVEFMDHIGGPNDSDITSTLQKCLSKQGMKFRLNTKVLDSVVNENSVTLNVEGKGTFV